MTDDARVLGFAAPADKILDPIAKAAARRAAIVCDLKNDVVATKEIYRAIISVANEYAAAIAALPPQPGNHQSSTVAEHESLRDLVLDTTCPGGGWNGMPDGMEATVKNCLVFGNCGCKYGSAIRAMKGAPTNEAQS